MERNIESNSEKEMGLMLKVLTIRAETMGVALRVSPTEDTKVLSELRV